MARKAWIVAAMTGGVLALGAAPAFADAGGVSGGPGYSPPPQAVANCNAGHGAFGAFGGNYNNLGINDLGSNGAPGAANPHNPAPGGITTGQNNSDFAAYCQTQ